MKIRLKEVGDIGLVEVEGEVDAEHSPQLKKTLEKARENKIKYIVLDLKKVSFIDSTGLGILISLMRRLKEEEGHLRLACLQEEVRSIFEITRLYRVFDISESAEDALKKVKGSGRGETVRRWDGETVRR